MTAALRERAVRYRPLAISLIRREVRQRYKGSAFGLLWVFVAPLVAMIAYSVVFHYVFRIVDIDPYPLFLMSGLITWIFFSASALGAASSIVDRAALVKKVKFPRELIPLSVVGGHAVTLFASLALLVPVNLIFVPQSRSAALVILPVSIVLVAMMTAGFALILAAVNVYFRDVEHILAAVLLPWFFLTPVFYSPDVLPKGAEEFEWLAGVLAWGNWVSPFIDVVRDPIFFGEFPAWNTLGYCFAVAAAFLVLGIWVFNRLQAEMAIEL
jgi:ABC-type polysaccharide/polyol phosphate export permease